MLRTKCNNFPPFFSLFQGSTFVVDIPSPASGQAEFVVLRSRFDVAVVYEWNVGDEVSVSIIDHWISIIAIIYYTICSSLL